MESGESGDCMSKPKDDLISRSAALDAIDCWHIDFNSMDGAKVQTDCWRTIKELPAVDAVPVEWLEWRVMNAKYNGIKEAADAFDFVLKCWKEQEAR